MYHDHVSYIIYTYIDIYTYWYASICTIVQLYNTLVYIVYISVKKEDKEPAYLVCVCVRCCWSSFSSSLCCVVVGLPSPLLYVALSLIFLLLFFMLRCRWSSFSSSLCCVVVGLPVVKRGTRRGRRRGRRNKKSRVCRSKSHGHVGSSSSLCSCSSWAWSPYAQRGRFLR